MFWNMWFSSMHVNLQANPNLKKIPETYRKQLNIY